MQQVPAAGIDLRMYFDLRIAELMKCKLFLNLVFFLLEIPTNTGYFAVQDQLCNVLKIAAALVTPQASLPCISLTLGSLSIVKLRPEYIKVRKVVSI